MRLSEKFSQIKKQGRTAFMPYVCAGDPSIEVSDRVLESLAAAGADVIELGMPFSDPIADGPTIQRASQRALDGGMTTDAFFEIAEGFGRDDVALVAMTYYNIILQYGLTEFAAKCRETGVSGIIVPDLPIEESQELSEVCMKKGVDLIQLIAPTTPDKRIDEILAQASGLVYLVSLLGVTGARDQLSDRVEDLIGRVKDKTGLPICVGFGVSTKEQVKLLRDRGVDGVIVGSAIINVLERNLSDEKKMLKELERFSSSLAEAAHK